MFVSRVPVLYRLQQSATMQAPSLARDIVRTIHVYQTDASRAFVRH